jgi:hypothetical protein
MIFSLKIGIRVDVESLNQIAHPCWSPQIHLHPMTQIANMVNDLTNTTKKLLENPLEIH